jgi:hypothetical protein
VSQASPITANNTARSAALATYGSLSEMNCGSSVVKKTASFGFNRLVRRPWRKGEPWRLSPCGALAPVRRSERSVWIPRYTR